MGTLRSSLLLPPPLTEVGVLFSRDGMLVEEQILEENVPVQVVASLLRAGIVVPLLGLDLARGEYQLQLYVVDAAGSEARSEPLDFELAWPAPLSLELSSPVDGGSYTGVLAISGTVSSDSSLAPVLVATLAQQDGSGAAQPVALEVNGTAFSGQVTEPGDYVLTLTASDGLSEQALNRRFSLLSEPVLIEVMHNYNLNEAGEAVVGRDLALQATVTNLSQAEVIAFALESFAGEQWQVVQAFTAEQADWDGATAYINVNLQQQGFAPGPHALRLRADYNVGEQLSAYSAELVVDYLVSPAPAFDLRFTAPYIGDDALLLSVLSREGATPDPLEVAINGVVDPTLQIGSLSSGDTQLRLPLALLREALSSNPQLDAVPIEVRTTDLTQSQTVQIQLGASGAASEFDTLYLDLLGQGDITAPNDERLHIFYSGNQLAANTQAYTFTGSPNGRDVFYLSPTSVATQIAPHAQRQAGQTGVLEFGEDVAPENVYLHREELDLLIGFLSPTVVGFYTAEDFVHRITDYFAADMTPAVQTFVFSNGISWSGDEVLRQVARTVAWTPWLDRDNAGGNGDYELFIDHRVTLLDEFQIDCDMALGIEAQLADGSGPIYRPIDTWPQGTVTFDARGFACNNAQLNEGQCADYQVRFLCRDIPVAAPQLL